MYLWAVSQAFANVEVIHQTKFYTLDIKFAWYSTFPHLISVIIPMCKGLHSNKRAYIFHSSVNICATECRHYYEWLKWNLQWVARTGALGGRDDATASLLLSDGLQDSNKHIRGLKCSREKGPISSTTSITHPLPRQAGALLLHSIYADQVHMFPVRVFFLFFFLKWAWFSNAPGSAHWRWGQPSCQLLNAKRSDVRVAVMNSK